jgi:hypothetical protein
MSAATARWLFAAFLAAPLPAAAGFFGDLPGRGDIQQDPQVDAVRRGAGIDRSVPLLRRASQSQTLPLVPFSGAPWDDLARLALEEPGRR